MPHAPSARPPTGAPPRARRRVRVLSRPVAVVALLGSLPLLAQQPWDIALRDGLLSIRANGAPITELAAALAAETGVSFVVTGDAGTPVTTEIVDEPFAKAVAKLSPNHMLIKDGDSRDARVVEVVLMLDDAAGDGGGGGGDGFLPSGAPADEIVGAEEIPAESELLPEDAQQFDESQQLDGTEPFDDATPSFDGTVQPLDQDGVSPDGALGADGQYGSQLPAQ